MRDAPQERSSHGIASSPTNTAIAVTTTNNSPRDALITQKPILKRNPGWLGFDDARFIGYENQGDQLTPTIVEHTCNSNYTFSTSGSYYGCCATSSNVCSFATNCVGNDVEYEGGYQLFEGGVISRCSAYCVTAALFRSIGDQSPYTHIGCSGDYRALRTTDVNAVGGWAATSSLASGPPVDYTTTRTLGLTPTPGEVFVSTDNEGTVEQGLDISWHIPITKLSGGIAGGIILVGIIVLWILGRRKTRRDERKRLGMGGRIRPQRVSRWGPSYFNRNQVPQEDGIVYLQQHELAPLPQTSPEIQRDGPPPAYQVFQSGPQRAGYESI